MFKFKDVKKLVVNLDRRPERLIEFQKEMDFMGWEFERFSAIDKNSYVGCALSHKKIAEEFLKTEDEYLLVMEDDLFFMPYTKEIIEDIEKSLNETEWDFFHLGPSLHRPVDLFNEHLIDLTNVPPKDEDKHRGIFGTTAFVLTKKSAEVVANWDTNKYIINNHQQIAIDDYFYRIVYKECRSLGPAKTMTTQVDNFSDIGQCFYSNHYNLTYNWNAYVPQKIPQMMYNLEYCKNLKNES